MKRPAVEIAALYKRRWQIELLFRWVKQHLRIRKFLGNNDNAIRVQLFAAMIAYALLRIAANTHQDQSADPAPDRSRRPIPVRTETLPPSSGTCQPVQTKTSAARSPTWFLCMSFPGQPCVPREKYRSSSICNGVRIDTISRYQSPATISSSMTRELA